MARQGAGGLQRLNEAVWLRIPSAAPSRMAQICTDGLYLSAWPVAGALALPLAAVAGFLLGAMHLGYDQPDRILFLYSLGTMAALLAISQNGAACGAAAWAGFVLGDFGHVLLNLGQTGNLVMLVPTRVLAAAILAAPLISTPVTVRALTQSAVTRSPPTRAAQAGSGVPGTLLRVVGVQGL